MSRKNGELRKIARNALNGKVNPNVEKSLTRNDITRLEVIMEDLALKNKLALENTRKTGPYIYGPSGGRRTKRSKRTRRHRTRRHR
jgi:hypothetical protein